MTKAQIKKLLAKNGIVSKVSENETIKIEILSKDEVEVYVADLEGYVDYDANEKMMEKVSKLLGWGGFKTGYGSWILQEGYLVNDMDYCDVLNPIHY